jgi:addiction module HigA family antidote
MEDYIHSNEKRFVLVGDFLKAHLKTFEIKQNIFANYIGLRPSNLNKVIRGERPLNHEIALIIGKIFHNDPMLWLDIQDKNRLKEIAKEKGRELDKYSLSDLIE